MNIFKRIFRKPAILFVTLWAKYVFRQGIDAAERRCAMEGRVTYLAASSFRPDHLITYTKPQFKVEKKVYGMAARLLTMNTLKRGCYYYTADQFGRNGMEPKEVERRKKAFIKERLELAGLI